MRSNCFWIEYYWYLKVNIVNHSSWYYNKLKTQSLPIKKIKWDKNKVETLLRVNRRFQRITLIKLYYLTVVCHKLIIVKSWIIIITMQVTSH